jgi:hypothetical protein
LRYQGFIGPSYTLDSKNIDAQRCVNFYPKMNEMGNGKEREVAALIPTPGLVLLATIGTGPIRGTYTASNGFFYVVSGNRLYYVNSSWAASQIGILNTSSGQVDFADNGNTLVLVDGDNGYWHTFSSGIITEFSGLAWRGSTKVNYVDGYFLFNDPNTKIFYISDLNSVDLDSLEFATADGSPDNILSTLVNHREVWLFGTDSIETWYNSGNPDFPFERIGSGFIEMGLAAAFSVAKIDKTTLWLGRSKEGQGIVYSAQGLSPQRISTHAVELAIQSYGDISDAVAWTYQENGHFFYVLNFTDANTTWVYDLTSGIWHERAFLFKGNLQRHRANSHSFAYNTHVVGDYENGKIYKLDSEAYSDAGSAIKRLRTAPHLSNSAKRVAYHSFELDVETGVGLTGSTQGIDPKIVLEFSDDGGHNWSNEKWTSLGKIGTKKTRVIWRKLGMSRDRIFRVSVTDPVKVTLLGAELEVEGMAG